MDSRFFSIFFSVFANIFVSVACRQRVKRKVIKKISHNLTSLYNFIRRRLFAEFPVGTFHKNCAVPYSEAFCRDNRYPSSEYRCSCTYHLSPIYPPSGGFATVAEAKSVGREGKGTERILPGKVVGGGRLTTCHTLRAWHAGLIIPWRRVSIRLLPWKWMKTSSREDKRSHRCTGLDRSFLSSYRIHLDVESLKLFFYPSFWSL